MLTLMGVLRRFQSAAQPRMTLQSARSRLPVYRGVPAGVGAGVAEGIGVGVGVETDVAQLYALGLPTRFVVVDSNLMLRECGSPFFRTAGVGMLKPWTPLSLRYVPT